MDVNGSNTHTHTRLGRWSIVQQVTWGVESKSVHSTTLRLEVKDKTFKAKINDNLQGQNQGQGLGLRGRGQDRDLTSEKTKDFLIMHKCKTNDWYTTGSFFLM